MKAVLRASIQLQKITPHAFLKPPIPDLDGAGRNRQDTADFGCKDLVLHMNHHLDTMDEFATEFSSWALGPFRAVDFAKYYLGKSTHIVVIDTQKLDRKVEIFHTPAISRAVESCRSGSKQIRWCEWEYLAHGPISGHGFYSVSIDVFTKGILRRMDQKPITEQEVARVKETAMAFGLKHDKRRELFIFIVVSLLSWIGFYAQDVETLYHGLSNKTTTSGSGSSTPGVKIPGTFMRQDWIMTDVVLEGNLTECKNTIKMLRALTYRHFGASAAKGMRVASPQLEEAQPDPIFPEYQGKPSRDSRELGKPGLGKTASGWADEAASGWVDEAGSGRGAEVILGWEDGITSSWANEAILACGDGFAP